MSFSSLSQSCSVMLMRVETQRSEPQVKGQAAPPSFWQAVDASRYSDGLSAAATLEINLFFSFSFCTTDCLESAAAGQLERSSTLLGPRSSCLWLGCDLVGCKMAAGADHSETRRLIEFAAKAAETFVSAYYSASDSPHRVQVSDKTRNEGDKSTY